MPDLPAIPHHPEVGWPQPSHACAPRRSWIHKTEDGNAIGDIHWWWCGGNGSRNRWMHTFQYSMSVLESRWRHQVQHALEECERQATRIRPTADAIRCGSPLPQPVAMARSNWEPRPWRAFSFPSQGCRGRWHETDMSPQRQYCWSEASCFARRSTEWHPHGHMPYSPSLSYTQYTLAKELQHEVTIVRRQIVTHDRHEKSRRDSTLARFQRLVAVTACQIQITTGDVIVVTCFGIGLRKSAPTICTSWRVGTVRRFGSSQRYHWHVVRKNSAYRLPLGEDVTKEIRHHVPAQVYNTVCSVKFVVCDA